jgi:hypothetical protein
MSRTNIEIDDQLVKRVMRRHRQPGKRPRPTSLDAGWPATR